MVFDIEKLKFIVYTRISTRNLTNFEPTRPDPTRPFDIRSDSYSTNLPLDHSLIHIYLNFGYFSLVDSAEQPIRKNLPRSIKKCKKVQFDEFSENMSPLHKLCILTAPLQ